MKPMKLMPILVLSGSLLFGATLSDVKSVYVMPMGRGLDQFIANRIAAAKVFTVVTDPKLADAILTDRVGDDFARRLDELAPLPAEPAEGDAKSGQSREAQLGNPASNSSFGRAKGTFFLVDTKSREVLWSTFEQPKSSDPRGLDRGASVVVDRLKKSARPKNTGKK
jgi:hypothetical protein